MEKQKARLVDTTRDYNTMKIRLVLEFEKDISKQVDSLRGIPLAVTIKKYRQGRSLDANAYYWVLITKLAEVLNVSKPYLHNLMLRRYGRSEVIDGKQIYLVLPDTEDGEKRAAEAETYHIRPTSEVKAGADGLMYRTYVMLRGSSTYDTREMYHLINGLIAECKEQNIETATPDELDRMMAAYERNWGKKHENSATG